MGSVVMKEEKLRNSCVFCNKLHSSSNCEYAHSLSMNERKGILIKSGACFRCLKRRHMAKCCTAKIRCRLCGRTHMDIMCWSSQKTESPFDSKGNKNKIGNELEMEDSVLTNKSCSSKGEVYLQTLVVCIKKGNLEHYIRIIIDTGSQKSFISKFAAEKMGFNSLGEVTIRHGLFGGIKNTEKHKRYLVQLSSIDRAFKLKLEVMDQHKICTSIPKIENARWIKELKERDIYCSDTFINGNICLFKENVNEIHLLIGADYAGQLFTGEIEHLPSGLVAVKTHLGWTVMGKSLEESKADSSLLVLSLHVNDVKLSDLWELDSLGILDPSENKNREEEQDMALKHFEATVSRKNDGRYQVCLPWIEGHPTLVDHKILAEKRLKNTVKSLKTIEKLEAYEDVFNEWEKEGIIEKIDLADEQVDVNITGTHYLPHRAVIKENSTTKIRPVFDGSAKTRDTPSLNDCVVKGPNLIELIPAVLNRFRLGKIGVVSDIRKAFLQIGLNPNDRNFLRFLWWKEGNPQNLITYKHCRLPFGISCSPFLLSATLAHHLERAPEHLRDIAEKLKDSTYVDNCVTSVNSIEELEYFRLEAKNLLLSAKFDLRGWVNNYVNEMPMINKSEEIEVSVLGLSWNIIDDSLSCDIRINDDEDEPITKRKILSLAHKIFDPIGYTCPITLIPKLILQECWKLKASWDSKLPDDIVKRFLNWKKQMRELKTIVIPRRLSELPLDHQNLTLHVFCDACKTSYATCVFLRVENGNEVTCQLVQARTRVAPLKNISIPRLELLACNIGARLVYSVKTDLRMENIETFCWSDSMDAIFWIKGEGPWATFVLNRVNEIRKLTLIRDWNYVPGVQNPADLPSRGCTMKTLQREKWWEGPEWLRERKENWPRSEILPDLEIINSEKRKKIVSAINTDESLDMFDRFSSYNKLLRVIAWIRRFRENSKVKKEHRISGSLSVEEINQAEIILLKIVQKNSFTGPNDKGIRKLQPVVDSDGLIRVQTRISRREDSKNFRLPILLPSDNTVVEKLIRTTHLQNDHAGTQFLISALREKFWIIKCRKTVRKIIRCCVRCLRFESQPVQAPVPPLPVDRVRDAAVFEIVGIDLAGPLFLKEGLKVWIVIYTCAIYRAVHCELISSLSTEYFLLSLRRFIARRGRPTIVYSDNGTNFKGSCHLFEQIDWNVINDHAVEKRITWKFIPPSAPWWGGWWERLIGILKRIIRRVLGRASLNYEEVITLICDCESLMNHRPLTYVSDDLEDLVPLTPSMFLHDIKDVGVPDLDQIDEKQINKRYRYRLKLREDLRKRFRIEYLGQLKNYGKKVIGQHPLTIGDIVLIESNKKRLHWPLGKIIELIPGKDGIVRLVKLRTKFGELLRPIQRLYPLEVTSSGDEDFKKQTTSSSTSVGQKEHSENSGVTPVLKVPEIRDLADSDKPELPRVSRYGRVVRAPLRLNLTKLSSTLI